MILGMSLETFTLLHVVISLVGIGSGLIVLFGLISNKWFNDWTLTFLITTALTSITGFLFPITKVTPGIVVGILSIAVLLIVALARYSFHLNDGWRRVYVIGATMALYFNVFVLIVQSFQKVPALKSLAPKQTEPPFAVTQLAVFVIFVVAGVLAVKKFRPEAAPKARAATA